MTGCSEYKILIQKLLDREISTGERARLEQHISLCRDCAKEFKAIQSGLHMLISMPVPAPGAEFISETVTKAFRAKKELVRRQNIMSWCLSASIAIISLFIIAGWSLGFQPAIRWVLSSAIQGFSQCSVFLTALNKMVSAICSILWTLGGILYTIICYGCDPGFIYLTALLAMILSIFLTTGKHHLFLLNRR